MKHRAMTSAVFELIQTFEFDMTLGDDSWPTRVELYQATTQPNLFRCRVWQAEFYRMQSTFPQNGGFRPMRHLTSSCSSTVPATCDAPGIPRGSGFWRNEISPRPSTPARGVSPWES